MSFIIPSKSSPLLLSSEKEVINRSDNSVVINNDSLLLNHYSNTIPYIERDDIKLTSLYHHPNEQKEHSIEGGSAVDEEDTEDEDDDEDLLSSVTTLNEQEQLKAMCTSSASAAASLCTTESLIKKLPLSSSHTFLPPIQTYSPQLNLSLYSPSITIPVSSIRSKKNRAYPTSSLSTFAATNSCLKDTSTVQNPTNISSFINKPLYSTPVSSSIASTLKMDIRSPPQPSQSTSRFMNAFQRLRGSSTNHRNQNVNTNSVTPAEILNVKPSPSKSSLADKIKNKFQQLDKKKRISVPESSTNRKNKRCTLSEKSIPRSTSLSSISNWSSRLTANNKSNIIQDSILSKQQIKLSHSNSDTSFISSKTSLSSSSSSNSSCSSKSDKSNYSPTFTLTKSISSHRIYKNNTTIDTRPRQPLRAVNPNDSVRMNRHLKSRDEKKRSQVRFTKLVSVKETYSKIDYDRGSDPEAVCTRLTPTMAQQIKEELNAYKLHEMQVHEFSRVHTHFFL